MPARARVLLLAPADPAPTGNGLAMRLWSWLRAAAVSHDVDLVVVPAYARSAVPVEFPPNVRVHGVHPVALDGDRDLTAWLADPVWRTRLAAVQPVDPVVRACAPTLASRILALLPAPPSTVLACRMATAPLGWALAEATGARLVVDADDDDAQLYADLGERERAAAAGRLADLCLPAADLVGFAAAADAAAAGSRWGLGERAVHVPNCIQVPTGPAPAPAPGRATVLLLGNLTYRPNVDGAQWLVHRVLPLLPAPWTVHLVGRPADSVRALAGPRVRVYGQVDDVAAAYARCSVVAVPLLHGGGTRIKVLEACSRRRPVVATSAGAAGLDLRDGTDLLLADDPSAFAAAVQRAGDRAVGDALTRSAYDRVAATYAADVVWPRLDALLRRVQVGHGTRTRLASRP